MIHTAERNLTSTDLNTALDNDVLTFATAAFGSALAPYGQTAVSRYGESAVRFGESNHSSTGCVSTTVRGPGRMTFSWKQSSEYRYDYLTFLDDGPTGVSSRTLKGNSSTSWKSQTVDVAAGFNTLTWQYSRNGTRTAGDNIAYLDRVIWKPRVRWMLNDGSSSVVKTDYPTTSSTAKLGTLVKSATRSGYVFDGWYTAKTGGLPVTSETAVPVAATDYYAHWKESASTPTLPIIECPGSVSFTPGVKTSVPVTVTSDYAGEIIVSVIGLPSGLAYADGLISGTPKACSETKVATVTARNAAGTVTKQIVFIPANPGFTVSASVPSASGGESTPVGEGDVVRPYRGVKFEMELSSSPNETGRSDYAANKVTVKGLCNGLSYDAERGRITGVPTKTSTQSVSVTFSNKWGWSTTLSFKIKPQKLPNWLVGDYNGDGNYGSAHGTSQLTVGTSGKLSGKIIANGKGYSFSAASFDQYSVDSYGMDIFTVRVKVNEKYYAVFTFAPAQFGDDGTLVGTVMAESEKAGKVALEAYQDMWQRTDIAVPAYKTGKVTVKKSKLAELGVATVSGDKLTLNFKADGVVSVSGALAGTAVSCSSTVVVTALDADGTATGEIVVPYGKKTLVLPLTWTAGVKIVLVAEE